MSVIIPVYNGEFEVSKCIDSILAQEYGQEQFEILVVDNGSTDKTCQVLQPYLQTGSIRLLSETLVLNAYGARNTGAKAAKGEILAFTDADCVASPDWLSLLLADDNDSTVGAFIGDILPYHPITVLERYYSAAHMSIKRQDTEFVGMRGGNCAIRRECFNLLNGFNAQISSGGDSDFLVRMLEKTDYKYKVAPSAVVYHKNLMTLSAIFRRHLRFGTNIRNLRHNPYLKNSYSSWRQTLTAVVKNFLALVTRLVLYPVVRFTGHYRGRKVVDRELFLYEPIIRLTELSGLMVGRTVRSKRFR